MDSRANDLYEELAKDGESAIDRLIADRLSEQSWIEFKTVTTKPTSRSLEQIDLNHLAKAISGFGNSAGGLLIWGVDSPSDPNIAPTKKLISDPASFATKLHDAVSKCTMPPHESVEHLPIVCKIGSDGFVATFVRKSFRTPLQCWQGARYYYIRAGSSFEPTPHDVLAGMFGSRPQPEIIEKWAIHARPSIRDLGGQRRQDHAFCLRDGHRRHDQRCG